MTLHEQIQIRAAASITEAPTAAEARHLQAHLAICEACRIERSALVRDHRMMRQLVLAEAVDPRVRAAVIREAQGRGGMSPWSLLAAATLLAILLAGLVAVAGGFIRPTRLADGFGGTWTTTDCAAWWEERPSGHLMDCDRWGDGSSMTLRIESGGRPRMTFRDADSSCASGSGSPPTSLAEGIGVYEGIFLSTTFPTDGCRSIGIGKDGELQLYRDAGSDTLWADEDGDGWGLIWYRVE